MSPDGANPEAGPGVHIRLATASDLPRVADIFAVNQNVDSRPEPGSVPSLYHHELAAGELVVAECGGEVRGFAALLTRGSACYLADLFVDPAFQSGGIGSRLLRQVLPRDGRPCSTLASSDPRALSLYARVGMRPYTPCFELRGRLDGLGAAGNDDPDVVEAAAGDPELMAWDRAIGGRERPQDHAYWVQQRGGFPLWFERGGTRVGYGYIQTLSDDLPAAAGIVTLGPIGVREAADAEACLTAALRWARGRGAAVRVTVPGAHPSLGRLLAVGLRIHETYYYCSTRQPRFADLARYLPSGGDLF